MRASWASFGVVRTVTGCLDVMVQRQGPKKAKALESNKCKQKQSQLAMAPVLQLVYPSKSFFTLVYLRGRYRGISSTNTRRIHYGIIMVCPLFLVLALQVGQSWQFRLITNSFANIIWYNTILSLCLLRAQYTTEFSPRNSITAATSCPPLGERRGADGAFGIARILGLHRSPQS